MSFLWDAVGSVGSWIFGGSSTAVPEAAAASLTEHALVETKQQQQLARVVDVCGSPSSAAFLSTTKQDAFADMKCFSLNGEWIGPPATDNKHATRLRERVAAAEKEGIVFLSSYLEDLFLAVDAAVPPCAPALTIVEQEIQSSKSSQTVPADQEAVIQKARQKLRPVPTGGGRAFVDPLLSAITETKTLLRKTIVVPKCDLNELELELQTRRATLNKSTDVKLPRVMIKVPFEICKYRPACKFVKGVKQQPELQDICKFSAATDKRHVFVCGHSWT
jgi:hypothetical protein